MFLLDVVFRGSSDGRGSDFEFDLFYWKLLDVKKDDMFVWWIFYGELKLVVFFN